MTTASTSRREFSREASGLARWALWLGWAAVAVASIVVAAASFDAFFGGPQTLIDNQGPLSVQPDLARQLEFRLFDTEVIQGSQSAVHVAGAALFFAGGILFFLRRPRDWIVALSSTALLLVGVALFAPTKMLAATRPGWEWIVEALGAFDAGPTFWRSLAGATFLLFAFVFPDGRFSPAWTRWVFAAYLGLVVLWSVLPGVSLINIETWPSWLQPAWTLGLGVVAISAQLYRYFRVSGTETRKQTRLVVISLAIIVGSFLLIWVLDPGLSRNVDFGLVLVTERTQAIYDLNILSFLTLGVVLFPISIGVSVARYRLFDMDLIINRALVYGTTTAIVGAVLLATAVLVGGAVEGTFGRGVGIGLGGVLMAALYQPLRVRVQSAIDRRFYPAKYDAERTLGELADRLRDEVDLTVIKSEIVTTVDNTLRPTVANLAVPSLDPTFGADERLLRDVLTLEANRPIQTGSELLAGDASSAFALRNIELVVPFVSHGELGGVLELGPRRDGSGYSALDQQLLRKLAEQTAPIIRYAEVVAREAEERAARQSYEQELALAEQIQRDLLPRRLPELDGWEVGAQYQPSRQVSGDLYDFIDLGEARLGIVIADVTDKGVPAAMVMATCRSVLRAAATGTGAGSPGEVLTRVNTLLIPDIPERMFVTCFYAVLDVDTGDIVFANAGQNLPILRSSEGITELRATGMPLGLMDGMAYEEGHVVVAPGDSLLFYSDGLVEAHNTNGEMFGKQRVIDRIENHAGGPSLLPYLVESLVGFAGADGARDDDVTLVAIRRLGEPPDDAELTVISDFTLPSEQGGELAAADRVLRAVEDLDLPARSSDRLRTAVAEAVMNAMEHGNGFDPNLATQVQVLTGEHRLVVRVWDHGQELPPESAEPDLDAKLAGEQPARGWGLFLIRNMVDELAITREEERNVVTLTIALEGESA